MDKTEVGGNVEKSQKTGLSDKRHECSPSDKVRKEASLEQTILTDRDGPEVAKAD